MIWYTKWRVKRNKFSKEIKHRRNQELFLNFMRKNLLFNYILRNMKKFIIETWEENEILRTISEPIKSYELAKYKPIAMDMIKYIKDEKNGGVWLAAPQIWVNKRLIVIALMKDYDDENYRVIAMINPEILDHSEEKCSAEEWCLSVPWESWDVERWSWVKVSFIDQDGKKYSIKLENLAARIVQHEIDHLDGILFTDKLEEGNPLKK